MPSQGARESFVRMQPQAGAAGAASQAVRPRVVKNHDPAAQIVSLLEQAHAGLNQLAIPEDSAVATPALRQNAVESLYFDPRTYMESSEGNGRSMTEQGRQQILERVSKLLPQLMKHDVRDFNFYAPGMKDHFDHPPTVIREALQCVAAALWFGATPTELKKLKPLLENITDKIAYIDKNSRPPSVAARPSRELSTRLGSLMPEHPMVMPVETT